MPRTHIRMRYDGPAVASHRMDVADLAPALLALGELCKLANRKFNGDRAAVRVLIHADAEHQCFELGFDLVQSLWTQALDWVGNDQVHRTKELLEWLGILGTVAGPLGLLQFLAWRKRRAVSRTETALRDGRDVVIVHVEGDGNNVAVYREAYELAQTKPAVKHAKKLVEPLKQEGYEALEFDAKLKGREGKRIDKTQAEHIMRTEEPEEGEEGVEAPQTITAWVKVYSPVFDPNADHWRFQFGDSHPYMDISETDIAEQALKRGGSSVDDAYKVRLEIRQSRTSDGGFKTKCKILEVLEFRPARFAEQQDWIEGSEDE